MALSLNQKKKKKKERKQDLSKEGRVSQFRFYKISHFFFNLPVNIFFYDDIL